LAQQEQRSDTSANNDALLGLAAAALTEGDNDTRTVSNETVDRRSFPADRVPSDDDIQPEVVVDTGMSAHAPAAVIASSSETASQVDVAGICRPPGRPEVADDIALASAAQRPSASKVRFDPIHCRNG